MDGDWDSLVGEDDKQNGWRWEMETDDSLAGSPVLYCSRSHENS